MANESVWLTQPQIALLFGVQRPAITKHLRNIFKSGELEESSVSSILEHMLDKRNNGVTAEIYTHQPTPQLLLDIQRHDSQYAPIPVHTLTRSHDRFLLLDEDVYHIGASLKDLGKRWFAIMKMLETTANDIMEHL